MYDNQYLFIYVHFTIFTSLLWIPDFPKNVGEETLIWVICRLYFWNTLFPLPNQTNPDLLIKRKTLIIYRKC